MSTLTAPAFVHPSDQAAERGSHYVEGAVRVYLMRDLADTDKWVIDPASFGSSLELDDEIINSECQCEKPQECDAVRTRMHHAEQPDGEELMHMLADALGYTVTKN
ncbi:hypothetical protein [Glutamicibacter creatinolyticus]|uniref:hypothetical protein n=1 Tax=Glutamicibacter creatinolyticus TaxID=162496 RepID=UPI003216E562